MFVPILHVAILCYAHFQMGGRRGHLHRSNKGGLLGLTKEKNFRNLNPTQPTNSDTTSIFCSWMFVFPGCDVHSRGQ